MAEIVSGCWVVFGIANGQHADDSNVLGDVKGRMNAVSIDTRHLMDTETSGGGFKDEVGGGEAEVVLGGSVGGSGVLEGEASAADDEHGGEASPGKIDGVDEGEHSFELLGLGAGRDEVAPGLLVSGGCGPARCFEECEQIWSGDGTAGKNVGANACGDQGMNLRDGTCGDVHGLVSVEGVWWEAPSMRTIASRVPPE